jgi:hypothetical protein
VKHRRVWEIVTNDLAPLKTAVETILHDWNTKAASNPGGAAQTRDPGGSTIVDDIAALVYS